MKCFISRVYSLDVDVVNSVQNVLNKLKIDNMDIYSESLQENSGEKFENLIEKVIRESDFVIGILSNNSQNVLFEIGIAVGMKKPIFLLFEENVNIPFCFKGMTYIRINKNLENNLVLPLSCFIESRKKDAEELEIKKDFQKPLTPLCIMEEDKIKQLNVIRESGDYKDYEKFVMQLFEEISQQYTTTRFSLAKRDKGYDFVVWVDELDNVIANPLYFNLKFGDINRLGLEETLYKSAITIQDGGAMIVLYCDRKKRKISSKNNLFKDVIVLDIEKFVHLICEYDFTKAFIYIRNCIAHGKEF